MENHVILSKNNKGSALAYIIMILAIISILTLSISYVFNANLKQTKQMQNSLEAYYLAYSSVLVGYEALLANNNAKLDILTSGSSIAPSTIVFDNGTAVVTVGISEEENFENWIKVSSVATVTRNNVRYSRTLYFDPNDPLDILWDNN